MENQVYRYLRGYTLDPGFSTQLDSININITTYRVRWEALNINLLTTPQNINQEKSLVNSINGEYFEVIDIDPSSNCYYEPVDLNATEVLSQNGLQPSEGNPKFHQQFVYTIAMKTLEQFEQSLGRRLIWNPRKNEKGKYLYVGKIRLYPHALRDANAYYDSMKKSILFGYFKSSLQVKGTNFPGGSVFTCLSPDIIAHEVTHALLDSIHPRFIENTNKDVPAFHEGFADIIALLQRFTNIELVINQLSKTQGSLDKFNILGELATQFGLAIPHGRGALRSAIGNLNEDGKWVRKTPDPTLYRTSTEPHERGSILVATFFDAFIKIYNYKTADLLRICSNGTGILPEGAIHPDLAKRLAQEACQIAGHLLNIAIRALDYCPPLDITFGDFLRALITADIEFAKADENNYRVALIDAFRSWGIFPEKVNTLSEESLQWSKPHLNISQKKAMRSMAKSIEKEINALNSINDREIIWDRTQDIQAALHGFLMKSKQTLGVTEWNDWLEKMGLTSKPINFSQSVNIEGNDKNETPLIEIHKVRPAYRVGNDGLIIDQVIVTITQSITIEIDLGDDTTHQIRFRGGSTIIFDRSKNFSLNYIISKNLSSYHRFKAQAEYQLGTNNENAAFSDSMYEDNTGTHAINFAQLHFH